MGERANSKAEQVYGAVKEAILSGALEPGEPIDKLALCDRLGVSRDFPFRPRSAGWRSSGWCWWSRSTARS